MILRLYSGFEAALRDRTTSFAGLPSIAKLIEGLPQVHDVRILFARRPGALAWPQRSDVDVAIPGIAAAITVLAGEEMFRPLPSRIRQRFALWRQMGPMIRMWRSFRPEVIYIDRGHLFAAAMFARFGRTPVVWRVMGVPDSLRSSVAYGGLRAVVRRWLLRSPFAAVICTLEGSGQAWLERVLRPGVPRYFLLGGRADEATPHAPAAALPDHSGTRVVFVGRLESIKGCEEFVAAFAKASAAAPGELHAVVVGDGGLAAALRLQAQRCGAADRITFTGGIEHRAVLSIVACADIYVSLNRMGNLSNANLEALAAGTCMVLPQSDPVSGIDTDTDELIPADVALRFGAVDDVERLAGAILHLHRHPHERSSRAAKAKALAATLLVPWRERIAREIALIEQAAANGTAPIASTGNGTSANHRRDIS